MLQEPSIREMSFDFTPETDRQRIQFIAFQRPDLLRHPVTREKLYNRHVLSRKVGHDDIGSSIMYRDFYMSGWSARDVTADDVRLEPMITGRGKMCRLMATMGVARGIGDHGLMVKASYVSCKEFLTCQPEIRVLDLKGDYEKCLNNDAYLIMGTDGLWDVMKNSDVRDVVKDVLSLPKSKEYEDFREELGQIIARYETIDILAYQNIRVCLIAFLKSR
jgi:protein phosphatase 1H